MRKARVKFRPRNRNDRLSWVVYWGGVCRARASTLLSAVAAARAFTIGVSAKENG